MMECNVDKNIKLVGFEKTSPSELTTTVNEWLDKNREKIIIKKFVEQTIRGYCGIIIYYIEIKK
jgi:hypothetical protein